MLCVIGEVQKELFAWICPGYNIVEDRCQRSRRRRQSSCHHGTVHSFIQNDIKRNNDIIRFTLHIVKCFELWKSLMTFFLADSSRSECACFSVSHTTSVRDQFKPLRCSWLARLDDHVIMELPQWLNEWMRWCTFEFDTFTHLTIYWRTLGTREIRRRVSKHL